MRYYATLGPSCCEAEVLAALLRRGVTGFRLNLSHTPLAARRGWIDALRRAERDSGRAAQLMIDLRGPEVRIGALDAPITLTEGETVTLGRQIPVAQDVLEALTPEIRALAGTKGSELATGGMVTKIHAAEIATEAGVEMIICHGAYPESLYDIVAGKEVGTRFCVRKEGI